MTEWKYNLDTASGDKYVVVAYLIADRRMS